MTLPRFTSSRPDAWIMPRPIPGDARRRQVNGPLVRMDEPTRSPWPAIMVALFAAVLGWFVIPALAVVWSVG